MAGWHAISWIIWPNGKRTLHGGLRLVLVEKEPSLESAQREMLAAHAERVTWLSPDEFSSGRFTFSGCLYSNELIDALPVHRVVMTADGLQEIYVTSKEGEFCEETGPLSTAAIKEYLARIAIELHPGQQAEINLAAPDWLASASRALHKGFILTIDYGFPAEELFAPHRTRGTLLCYHRHQTEENPYIRLGSQDITSPR